MSGNFGVCNHVSTKLSIILWCVIATCDMCRSLVGVCTDSIETYWWKWTCSPPLVLCKPVSRTLTELVWFTCLPKQEKIIFMISFTSPFFRDILFTCTLYAKLSVFITLHVYQWQHAWNHSPDVHSLFGLEQQREKFQSSLIPLFQCLTTTLQIYYGLVPRLQMCTCGSALGAWKQDYN